MNASPLPSPPRPRDPVSADWARRIVACLRSMRLSGGPGVKVAATPEGTTVSVRRSGAAAAITDSAPMPLDTFAAGGRIRVRNLGFGACIGGIEADREKDPVTGDAVLDPDADDWDLGEVPVSGPLHLWLVVAEEAARRQGLPVYTWAIRRGGGTPPAGFANVALALRFATVSTSGAVAQLHRGCVAGRGWDNGWTGTVTVVEKVEHLGTVHHFAYNAIVGLWRDWKFLDGRLAGPVEDYDYDFDHDGDGNLVVAPRLDGDGNQERSTDPKPFIVLTDAEIKAIAADDE